MAAEQEQQRVYERGMAYLAGDGVPHDPEEAAKWLHEAAANGHVPAMRTLGDLHAEGRGVERSASEAARWYHEAAQHGDDQAAVLLERLAVTPPQLRLTPERRWNRRRIVPDLVIGRGRAALGLSRRGRTARRRQGAMFAGSLVLLAVAWPALALLGGASPGAPAMLWPWLLCGALLAAAPLPWVAGRCHHYLRFDLPRGDITILRFTPFGVRQTRRPLSDLGRIQTCDAYWHVHGSQRTRRPSPYLDVCFRAVDGERLAKVALENDRDGREKVGLLGRLLNVPVEALPPVKPWGY